MIAVFVTFQYGGDFDEAKITKIAAGARARFDGMPGLRSKLFAVRAESRQAANVYIWESEAAAKAFFTDAMVERVTSLYGVRPSVEYAQIAELVDNAPA